MAVEIKEVGVESLPRYAEIPISFKVESILQVETISKGFGFGVKFCPETNKSECSSEVF